MEDVNYGYAVQRLIKGYKVWRTEVYGEYEKKRCKWNKVSASVSNYCPA